MCKARERKRKRKKEREREREKERKREREKERERASEREIKRELLTSGHLDEQQGGSWLVGARVRVYYDDDVSPYAATVTGWEGEHGYDSHGQYGPLHHLRYDLDGDFTHVLSRHVIGHA